MSFCNTKRADSYCSVIGPEMSVFSITSESNVQTAERKKKLKTELPCTGFNKLCSFVGFPPPQPVSLQLILERAQFSKQFSAGVVVFTTKVSIFMLLNSLKHTKKTDLHLTYSTVSTL